ncbi:MAG TPA: type II toxin-antitoxin system MqsA family antitoxin [Acetobacteraceae bacterium]|nr:type II toxin-antitoxin system MqsA family antitoxin [Acetobacteraceae bacterium]
MSTTAALKERLARLGPVRDVSRRPLPSDESIPVVLRRTDALDKGVSVARRLFAAGLTLKQAHEAINKLAALGWASCAIAKAENLALLSAELAALNVELRRRRPILAYASEITAMRGRLGLSQRDYADFLGIDVRTLQNWEQGRNKQDASAISLMRVFEQVPDAVEQALTEPVT